MAEAYSTDPEWWKYVLSPVVLASITVILLCRFILSPILVNTWIPKEKLEQLGPKKAELNTYLGSTVHAVEAVVFAGYILNTGQLESRVFSITPTGITAIQITFGYCLADILILLYDFQHCEANQKSQFINFFIHHISMAAGLLLCFYYQLGMYHIIVRFLGEFSTPFVNWRAAIYEIGDRKGRWYFLASAGMTLSFFLCRIAVIPWHNYMVFTDMFYVTIYLVPWYLNLILIINFTAFDILNVYWFYRILKGLFRYLAKQQHVD